MPYRKLKLDNSQFYSPDIESGLMSCLAYLGSGSPLLSHYLSPFRYPPVTDRSGPSNVKVIGFIIECLAKNRVINDIRPKLVYTLLCLFQTYTNKFGQVSCTYLRKNCKSVQACTMLKHRP